MKKPKTEPGFVREFDCELEDAPLEGSEGLRKLEVGTVQVGGAEFSVYRFSVSSETPVVRTDWNTGQDYLEVLSHDPKDVDLRRFKDGASYRDTHYGDQVGVVEDASISPKRKLLIDMRFSKSQRGQEIERDHVQRIRRNVSIRYVTKPNPKSTKDEKTGMETRTFKWTAIHACTEPDGADPNVGVDRALPEEPEALEPRAAAPEAPASPAAPAAPAAPLSTTREQEKNGMTEEERKAQEAAAQEAARSAVATAVANRNKEVLEITTLARDAGVADDAIAEMIGRGIGKQDAALEILTRSKPKPSAPPTSDPLADLSRKERGELRKHYSVVRALELSAEMKATGSDRCLNGIEGEHHKRLAATAPVRASDGSFLIPYAMVSDQERMEIADRRNRVRTLGTSTAGAGAELVYDMQPVDIIDVLRPTLPLTKMGANFIYGLRGELPMPRFLTGTTLYHRNENNAVAVTSSNPTTAVSHLRPKTVAGKVPIPKQLLALSQWDLNAALFAMIADDFAQLITRGAFHGDGTAYQPMGLYKLKGVNEVSTLTGNSFKAVYGDIVDMTTALSRKNVRGTGKGFVATCGLAGYLRKTLEFSAAGSTKIWTGSDEDGMVAGFPAVATEALKSTLGTGSDEHACGFGAWKSWNVGIFGDGLEILFDPFSEADIQTALLHTFAMYDTGTAVPEAFTRLLLAKIA